MAIKFKEFEEKFERRISEVLSFVETSAPDILGVEAVNHFKESFNNEGFTDTHLKKWPNVVRRDSENEWYGHSGQTGKFSSARTNANVLSGETHELRNAISYKRTAGGARVTNDKPYAKVHNNGGTAKIYGKKSFAMKERKFMGRSAIMKSNIEAKLKREILKRLRKK